MDFFKFLKEAGPYSAPLCVVMALAIIYLVKTLEKTVLRAEAGEKDATGLRNKIADRAAESAEAMGKFGEATRDSLRSLEGTIRELKEALEKERERQLERERERPGAYRGITR